SKKTSKRRQEEQKEQKGDRDRFAGAHDQALAWACKDVKLPQQSTVPAGVLSLHAPRPSGPCSNRCCWACQALWCRVFEWINDGHAVVVLSVIQILTEDGMATHLLCRGQDGRVPITQLVPLLNSEGG